MSKKKFRQGKTVFSGTMSIETLKIQLENALSDGRVRKAFLTAKELICHKDFKKEHLSLAAKAVELKMLQMHRENDDSQTGMMFHAVLSKAPGIRELIHPEYFIFLHWNDGNDQYFQSYESDPFVKGQLDAYVRCLLQDPRELSAHKHLRSSHPLK